MCCVIHVLLQFITLYVASGGNDYLSLEMLLMVAW